MNLYEIRALNPKKVVVDQVQATSAKRAERQFKRTHRQKFEEIQVKRVNSL